MQLSLCLNRGGLDAVAIIAGTEPTTARPLTFLRRASKWHRHLNKDDGLGLWKVAVLCNLRDAFRAGDIWLAHFPSYGVLKIDRLTADVSKEAHIFLTGEYRWPKRNKSP